MPYRGLYKPCKRQKPMPGYISLLEMLFGKKVRLKAILPGDELSPWDEELIRNNIPKLNRGKPKPRQKYQPISIATDLTVLQAAKEIGVHLATIYRWIANGVISRVKVDGILFIPKSEIERLKNVDIEEIYETNEAACLLGIGHSTLYLWIKAGKLTPIRIPGRTLIPKSEVERVKKNQAAEAA